MKAISERDKIIEKIEELRFKQSQDLVALKEQFKATQDSLKPVNLIKSTLLDVTSGTTTSALLDGALSIAGGFLSDKLLPKSTPKSLKEIGSRILRFVTEKFLHKKT